MVESSKRSRLTNEARRAQLLDAGKAIFSEHPYDGISSDGIARAANVSTGLLYHYFGSKRGYYLATIEVLAEELLSATEPGEHWSLQTLIKESLDRFIDFVAESPTLYGTLMRGGVGADSQANAIVEGVRATFLRRFEAALGGRLPPATRNALYGWISMTEACVDDWVKTRAFPREQLCQQLQRSLAALLANSDSAV